MVPDVAAPEVEAVAKKVKVWCWKCSVKTHAVKDCTVQHYCYICDQDKHPTHRCPTLRLPKPTTMVVGMGHDDTTFNVFPEMVFREHLAPVAVPTARGLVVGEVVSSVTVETQVARICPVQSQWRWEAIPNGANSFIVEFPSEQDLQRVDGLELGVPATASRLIFSQWKEEDVPHKMELKQVWVHVFGVPRPLRHFLGLWAVGTLIGSTLDVDFLTLRHRDIVRILVGMSEVECFNKGNDELGPKIRTDGILRTKGYDFTFRPCC